MAIGAEVVFRDGPDADVQAQVVSPVSVTADWRTVIDAGGIGTADTYATSGYPRVSTDLTASTTHMFRKPTQTGAILMVRLGYVTGLTGTIKVRALGRKYKATGADSDWQVLRTKDDSLIDVTLTPATGDCTDGTLKYTTPSLKTSSWDTNGCDQFVLTITGAATGGTGATAIIQVKFL